MKGDALFAMRSSLATALSVELPGLDTRSLLILATAAAVTVVVCYALYSFVAGGPWDQRLAVRLNRLSPPASGDALLRGVSHLGLFPTNGVIWLGLWLIAIVSFSEGLPGAAIEALELNPLFGQSAVLSDLSWSFTWTAPFFTIGIGCFVLWATCRLLKRRTDCPRPYQALEGEGVRQRGMRPSGSSFPSSHAAMVWYTWPLLAALLVPGASLLPAWIPTGPGWLVAALVIAPLVSFTRVYLGAHFPSDVLAGSVLGLGYAVIFYVLGGSSVRWFFDLLLW